MLKKEHRKYLDIFVRYLVLVLIGIPNLWLFYTIFTPLTVYPVLFLLGLFYDTVLLGNVILVNNFFPIEIISACVAGSAYYLLLILNLSIPMEIKKRIKLLAFSFASLLFINILRIFIFSLIFISGKSFFDFTHILFWYLGSVVFVVGIWFAGVKIFKVKAVPVYSDLQTILNKTKNRKRSKKNNQAR